MVDGLLYCFQQMPQQLVIGFAPRQLQFNPNPINSLQVFSSQPINFFSSISSHSSLINQLEGLLVLPAAKIAESKDDGMEFFFKKEWNGVQLRRGLVPSHNPLLLKRRATPAPFTQIKINFSLCSFRFRLGAGPLHSAHQSNKGSE